MEGKYKYKKAIGMENIIFMVIFFGIFGVIGHIMGATNMIMTLMATAYDLLFEVCFYIMAISVLAGAISGIFSEFGVIAFIHYFLSKLIEPIYDLPGASSLGILNCYLSDNPSILTLAEEENFLKYFKKYQIPALTNLGTSFGMGLIVTTTIMGLPVENSMKAAFIGNLGAIVGSIISVRLMLFFSKREYGTTEMVIVGSDDDQPDESVRRVREGSAGLRAMESLLDGGKVGVETGLSIIPGVLIICSMVMLLTNGPGAGGAYHGELGEGIGLLPYIGEKLSFILQPLFGFSFQEAIAVPITALGSAGAAVGLVGTFVEQGVATSGDLAVFTAICMCWSGYLSTHVAMMDALDMKKMTGKSILCHTIGGLCAGVAAHWIYMLVG